MDSDVATYAQQAAARLVRLRDAVEAGRVVR